jgi:hypothetical protein
MITILFLFLLVSALLGFGSLGLLIMAAKWLVILILLPLSIYLWRKAFGRI